MRRAAFLVAAVALAGCTSSSSEPEAGTSGTVAVTSPSAVATATQPAASPSAVPQTSTPVQPSPAVTKTPKPAVSGGASDVSFCDYLAQTADAAQQVEDPAQYVAIVKGAVAVAPGAIQQDVALFAQSVEKLAITVTGSPAKAAKADAWLSRNEAAVQQAQDNLNSYSLSTCGQPFVTGEGN